MPRIAIPGGTSSGLGRSIVTALSRNPKHTVLVLSRETSQIPGWLLDLRVKVSKVDYQDEEQLFKALDGVDVVICTLLPKDGTWCSTQLTLLRASLRAGVTRFAPAEFGCGPLAVPYIGFLSPQLPVWEACRAAVKDSEAIGRQFEWANFHVGLFMNYLGNGCQDEIEALAGKSDDGEFIFYMTAMKARIPLTQKGKIPKITYTEIGDVGRFVSAACDLPFGQWREDFGMIGSSIGMDEVVEIIEEVRGRKMHVEYRRVEDVSREKEDCKDEFKMFWLELEEMYSRDNVGEGIIRSVLNELCPDVKPTGVKEYVERFWSG